MSSTSGDSSSTAETGKSEYNGSYYTGANGSTPKERFEDGGKSSEPWSPLNTRTTTGGGGSADRSNGNGGTSGSKDC
ncbi:hypothetical protein B0T17DRAFT_599440 [Bombardia bombarda]|uniref:Uncharacterized protein n=1 Tax=Bombardia bombarda TaxID=252184 RepID=A0AA39X018_9PEZI|nr:hypothetical protein B0T17DRAFT_599440 [Bombardia bombarda]